MLFARFLMVAATMLVVTGCMQTNTGLLAQFDGVAPNEPLPLTPPPAAAPLPPAVELAPVPVALNEPPPLPPVVPLVGGPAQVEPTYRLDAGDKLRVIVFGQEGLTNSYSVDTAGRISMPLIGAVSARGLTTTQLAAAIARRLRNGYIREPHVAVEVEAYRPFFILGEVTYPGQYPFVAHMTVETAVAIAGGFTPRAYRWKAEVTRPTPDGPVRLEGPPMFLLKPGDTVVISERWF
ncbi:MAG: polysaccharide biosynthesis/export family protein [Xanthobacteraceae bacterium]